MKKIKSIISTVMMIVMVFAFNVSAFASTVTISNPTTGAVYGAYRILDLTTSLNCSQEHEHTEECYNYGYKVNSKYQSVLTTVTGKTKSSEIVAYIGAFKDNDQDIRQFADSLYKEIKKVSLSADATSNNGVFTFSNEGYYLIDEDITNAGDNETTSLVMLDTSGKKDITITTKKDNVTVEKKVLEDEDSTDIGWNDVADYDIGDTVKFKSTGTVPAEISSYQTYKYIFHDKMEKGLTFDSTSVVVKIDDVVVTSGYQLITSPTDDCTFEVKFDDLKVAEGANGVIPITPNTKVVVEYSAILNEDAEIANDGSGVDGNENEVYLEFSNNPYDEGTGETPKDIVVVYTFQIELKKVDEDKNPLEGAKFRLYSDKECKNEIKLRKLAEKVNGKDAYIIDPNGDDYIEGSDVYIIGLEADEGEGTTYYIKEVEAPDGYNILEEPIELTLIGGYELRNSYIGNDEDALKYIEYIINGNKTESSSVVLPVVTVENTTGTELPSTGGIGTRVFTIGGIVLMVGAVVVFVTKRKMHQ
ncbi:MAG TPA: SpaH/EbpB family LPXTG-anchored major pilin [Candidatus Fimicola cottocaccae]|nr:SpaH/EbpB family LPXTG-anchored major pilin [Candidatus Fimicola cottocaccae]